MNKSYVFFKVDMRIGIDGIIDILRKNRVKLINKDMAIFLNARKTIIKIMPSNLNTILYHREKRPIDPAIIPYIPLAFDGKELVFEKAVEKRITAYFKKKGRTQ